MFCWQRGIILGISVLVLSFAAYGQEISKEQIKGLDEQVQDIKGDVLGISSELNKLEEKLLYPSNTEVSVFISMPGGETVSLDSVEIRIDGKPVSHHLYTFKEIEALQKGGVQKIYTGNISTGEHDLEVIAIGKSTGNVDFKEAKHMKVQKEVGPKIVEISLAAQSITFKDR